MEDKPVNIEQATIALTEDNQYVYENGTVWIKLYSLIHSSNISNLQTCYFVIDLNKFKWLWMPTSYLIVGLC